MKNLVTYISEKLVVNKDYKIKDFKFDNAKVLYAIRWRYHQRRFDVVKYDDISEMTLLDNKDNVIYNISADTTIGFEPIRDFEFKLLKEHDLLYSRAEELGTSAVAIILIHPDDTSLMNNLSKFVKSLKFHKEYTLDYILGTCLKIDYTKFVEDKPTLELKCDMYNENIDKLKEDLEKYQ